MRGIVHYTSLHTTHMVAFQEKCPNSLTQKRKIKKKCCNLHTAVQENNFEARLYAFPFGINEIYRRQLSWPKRNACTHWAVSARKREVSLENIGIPERRAYHQSIRQHIVWYKTPEDTVLMVSQPFRTGKKSLKNYRKCVALVFIQALSSVTNFMIGGTRPERDTYLDRIIYQSI